MVQMRRTILASYNIVALVAILLVAQQHSYSVHAFSSPSPSKTSSTIIPISDEEATKMEQVVYNYFDGVNKKDPNLIRSCFGEHATIRDVCGICNKKRNVIPQDLTNRCMEFLQAHPDTVVNFYYGPECGRNSRWVVAHWYETGTWSGESCGIQPNNKPMQVEGQTRFYVNEEMKIIDMVVTRTFTEWENKLQQAQK